jgi:hypothetical protein
MKTNGTKIPIEAFWYVGVALLGLGIYAPRWFNLQDTFVNLFFEIPAAIILIVAILKTGKEAKRQNKK